MLQDTNKTILIFTINGINSLLGWNAVLAALDYFAAAFKDYNIYSFLPIPLFVGYITIGLTYHMLSNRFKYVNMIIVGNILINLSLLAILIVSIVLDQSLFGFIMLMFSSYMIGIGANISQLTFFAMINYLSQDVVSKFTVGTAVSGLFITTVRMIILAIAGAGDKSVTPIIIYFVIALCFNTFDLFLNIHFCKSSVYKEKIDKFLVKHDEELRTENGDDDNAIAKSLNSEEKTAEVDQEYVHEEERIEKQNYFRTLYETCMKIFPYPFIIMLTFVITFMLFPGPTLSKTFPDMDVSWSVVLFLMVYNIGDTVGKYTADFKNIFNVKSLNFMFFGRLVFFFTITIMANGADSDDPLVNNYVFPFINQLLFAITNGFCINASFIMAFKTCPLIYKKYAGVLCGITLQIGIMIGTILEIPYAYVIGIA